MQARPSARAPRRTQHATLSIADASEAACPSQSSPGRRGKKPERQTIEFEADPFVWTPHLAALFDRHVLIAPLVVLWMYRVQDPMRFRDWLAARDIVLNDQRLGCDSKLAGIRYCGTYLSGRPSETGPVRCTTIWGFVTRDAMIAMHELCDDRYVTRTIVQSDLFDFVTGLHTFLDDPQGGDFAQEVLVSSAAEFGRGNGG